MSKIRVGIFFGGQSREREVSFAGGRTVFDNLDKSLFEPIPLFVDSFGNFIELNWQNVYKGSIRDFYPPSKYTSISNEGFQIYAESLNPDEETIKAMANEIGTLVQPEQLKGKIDFAFLALHGVYGEDGSIQGLLEWLKIPYSGSGIFASALGMNKARQKDLQERAGLYVNHYQTLRREIWFQASEKEKGDLFKFYNVEFGEKFVVKPANQGSSLGVSVLLHSDFHEFCNAVDNAFFRQHIEPQEWLETNAESRISFIKKLTDIRTGLGLPLKCNGKIIFMPEELLQTINQICENQETCLLEALENETELVLEEYIDGREFSCIVVRDDNGNPLALPPTEIKKSTTLFDYRSKYLPGLSKKETPIQASDAVIREIREACVALYDYFGFNVYARIDGFISADEEIFLNDPNTTSGMMPSSFFFHQAAEIGLNPSRFLTFIIRNSLDERIQTHTFSGKSSEILRQIDASLESRTDSSLKKKKIAVVMGGYSFERHISMESGRNIYEKLSSSETFEPVPVFLTGSSSNIELYHLPLNFMLKDNADDIAEKIRNYNPSEALQEIIEEASDIIQKYSPDSQTMKPVKIQLEDLPQICDGVFIALHGRPGEDGTLQKELQKLGIFYNGSDSYSSEITINKYTTNEILRKNGFLVADHELIEKNNWIKNVAAIEQEIIERFGLPLIAKPADDGCSAAVRKVKSAEELHHFISAIFRDEALPTDAMRASLGLSTNEEFPKKEQLLLEKFIDRNNASRFLEITGGMLTHQLPDGTLRYEVFEPSEALAETEILSLEEKFLAGEGQNITPARFSKDLTEQNRISAAVRKTLEDVAKTLQVTGYCRIDAFVRIFDDGKIETIIIEINSLPGMTPATCIYHQAAINGYKPFDFIQSILTFGEVKNKLTSHA